MQSSFEPQHQPLSVESNIPLVSMDKIINPLLVRASVNNEEGLFFVDTGANVCVLSQQFARRLGIVQGSFSSRQSNTNVKSELKIAKVNVLRLGKAVFEDFAVCVTDMNHINQLIDEPIDGIIGMSLLCRFSFTIDYGNRCLVLNPRQCLGRVVPIMLESNALFVNVLADGQSIRMKIDTGSSQTSVDAEAWLTLRVGKVIQRRELHCLYINSYSVGDTEYISIKTLRLGDTRAKDLLVKSGRENILGMNLLKRYVVTFDFNQEKMYLNNE